MDVTKGNPTWAFLRRFRVETEASWRSLHHWITSATAALEDIQRELDELERRWAEALAPLDEVSAIDWRNFRPLRLGREEAWSDWLAHLLEQSATGELARCFLGTEFAVADTRRPNVLREVRTANGERRADLVIEWKSGEVLHIEVKTGDQDFDKTFETADLLSAKYGSGRTWTDAILLPPEDEGRWHQAAEKVANPRQIRTLTWRGVAVGARRALLESKESTSWRAWAQSFCGAVEQRILGCQPADFRGSQHGLARRAAVVLQLDLLREASK
ncbi:hypothetical protein [Anaeromyxobacter paludicola]|uniref:PD-(D/E)XK nuclease superfamily protein n=1 Tax=Anaeromyxobacter paludicola TaxID=2918171 RepID=A0ABM7X9T1_9BACT|nr:hypothetical protein [Anaeromyxobacter paludicola]BDG08593.1 hypothetical protein AMPC_17060 [Anaeromyxobacter paludicola]